MKKLSHQISWFVVVGATAALVHWLVVVALVGASVLAPLIANIIGWLVAFLVSFTGHYQITFRHQRGSLLHSVKRFFLLSAAGFLVNEASFAVLLYKTDVPYQLLLGLVLVGVAFLTFIASRFWAFTAKR
jgi:putative flippase GtrA